MDALRSLHTEAVAQAIASALGTGEDLEIVYAAALDSVPGCCEQCAFLEPALTRARCLGNTVSFCWSTDMPPPASRHRALREIHTSEI
jgi:hypothetical protein